MLIIRPSDFKNLHISHLLVQLQTEMVLTKKSDVVTIPSIIKHKQDKENITAIYIRHMFFGPSCINKGYFVTWYVFL